ncbi:hypothetical protein V6N11_082347 [Hibiscus sabdariffa]|uniref:Uncharacterized protein n=1 Tax=Hibiscus sabdariffa TaxID=183260 RepID=A0ABR2PC95_9ROSI
MAEMLNACQGAENKILHYMEMYGAASTLRGVKFRTWYYGFEGGCNTCKAETSFIFGNLKVKGLVASNTDWFFQCKCKWWLA